MRGSEPMPMRTDSMSAPQRSARLASSFMKLILVASMALAAYLVSSAERTSMTIMRSRLRVNGSYRARISSAARALAVPTTTRSGFMKSRDGRAFLQELRVRDHVEFDRRAARLERLGAPRRAPCRRCPPARSIW